jgi:hypothetical protein
VCVVRKAAKADTKRDRQRDAISMPKERERVGGNASRGLQREGGGAMHPTSPPRKSGGPASHGL